MHLALPPERWRSRDAIISGQSPLFPEHMPHPVGISGFLFGPFATLPREERNVRFFSGDVQFWKSPGGEEDFALDTYNLSDSEIPVTGRKKTKAFASSPFSPPLPPPKKKKEKEKNGIGFLLLGSVIFFLRGLCLIFQQYAERYEYKKSKGTHISFFLGSNLFQFYKFTPPVGISIPHLSSSNPFDEKYKPPSPPPTSSSKSINTDVPIILVSQIKSYTQIHR